MVGGVANAIAGYDPSAAHVQPDFGTSVYAFNVAGHALVGCAQASASGGSCGSGALSGAVGSALSPLTMQAFPNAQGDFGDRIGDTIVSATAGGLASIAGGGRFENGAITAAFGYMFNAEAPKRCDLFCQSTRPSDAIETSDDVLLLGVGGGLGIARSVVGAVTRCSRRAKHAP